MRASRILIIGSRSAVIAALAALLFTACHEAQSEREEPSPPGRTVDSSRGTTDPHSGMTQKTETGAKEPVEADPPYVAKLRAIDGKLNQEMQLLFSDPELSAAEIARADEALATAAGELRGITVPAEFQEVHTLYLRGVEGFRPVLTSLASSQGDSEAIADHLGDPTYARAVGDLESAKTELEKLAYSL